MGNKKTDGRGGSVLLPPAHRSHSIVSSAHDVRFDITAFPDTHFTDSPE